MNKTSASQISLQLWSSKTTSRVGVGLIVSLLAAVFLTQSIVVFVSDRYAVIAWQHLFTFDGDSTIPTWVASLLWLACGIALGGHIVAQKMSRSKVEPQWYLLAAISILFSIDEVARIHERIGGGLSASISGDLSGAFFWGWVIIGMLSVRPVYHFYCRYPLRHGGVSSLQA